MVFKFTDLRSFSVGNDPNPMTKLIINYRERIDLLCLDEFQVESVWSECKFYFQLGH